MDVDENLSFDEVLTVLQERLLPSGSVIVEGDIQVWPDEIEPFMIDPNVIDIEDLDYDE